MTNTNTTATYYSDAYLEYGSAYFSALSADEQWQRELDFQDIDRYSLEARGVAGSSSTLRLLYEKKLQADEALRNATDALRAGGRREEVEVLDDLATESS
jgi:hypothetical protein